MVTLARLAGGFLILFTVGAAPVAPIAQKTARPASPQELRQRLQGAWEARDAEAYLALWRFPGDEERQHERSYLFAQWGGEEAVLEVQPTPAPGGSASRMAFAAQVFAVTEPRSRVEQSLFHVERDAEGWTVVRREVLTQIDGLLHLSLDPDGYRADGLSVQLEDFELQFQRGTLFLSPPMVGPTVLVFVGEGTVRMAPRPPTEREQLRQFTGRPELVDKVRAVFLRIHPADLRRMVVHRGGANPPPLAEAGGAGLRPPPLLRHDPAAPSRAREAAAFFREHVDNSFLLDTRLPRSPWWLLPSLGDALATFRTASRGTLTYSTSRAEPESISLFDRDRRRQICLYPAAGREARYNEDSRRGLDVLHHDLTVRFQPDRFGIQGTSTLRVRLLTPSPTLRLRLDDSLRVHSIRSPQAGELLFFRVRHQDALMVSLGALAGSTGEISITVDFAGDHQPMPVEREVLQEPPPAATSFSQDEIPIENVLVYSNRTAWYPQGDPDDYAESTLRFDVPAGHMAVAGGTRTDLGTRDGRTRVEYRQDLPGKYVTVAVGRLQEAAQKMGALSLRGYAVGRTRSVTPGLVEDAAAMAAFFEREFGPCPYRSLNLVVIEGRTPGGHSPPGMIVLSLRPALLRGTLRDDPASFHDIPGFFLAHELAHQWWGHGVAGQNYHERWLSEAAAQYAAALWVRHHRGEETFRTVLSRMSRWALSETEEGPIHLGHRLGHIKNDPQIYRAIVYDKGAYVLHMIREMVGASAFRTALGAMQVHFRFAKAGTEDLREALQAASGRDLGPYFAEWIYGTTLPTLEYLQRTTADGVVHRTEVEVRPRGLPGPVRLVIAVTYAGGQEVRTVTLPVEGGVYGIETPGPPRKVEVNADRGLLARVTRKK